MPWILWRLCALVVIRHASAKKNISCRVRLSARDMPCGQKALMLQYWKKSPKLVPTGWQPSGEECSHGNIIIFCLFAATYLLIRFMHHFCKCNYFYFIAAGSLVKHHSSYVTPCFLQLFGFVTLDLLKSVWRALFWQFNVFHFLCGEKSKLTVLVWMVMLLLFFSSIRASLVPKQRWMNHQMCLLNSLLAVLFWTFVSSQSE